MRPRTQSPRPGTRSSRGPAAVIGSILLIVTCGATAFAGPIVTATQHKDLGFNATYPFHEHKGDSKDLCPFVPPGLPAGLSYSLDITGTANLDVAMGTDVTFSYDKADVIAGSTLPLNVTYAPTAGGSSLHLRIPVTLSVQGCIKDCFLPDLCDGFSIPCTFEVGPSTFTTPLNGDAPVVVPITSCVVSLNILGLINVGSAHVTGNITLSPMPAGGLAIGGADAAYGVTGPAGTSGIPVLQWETAGSTKSAGIALNNPLPASADIHVNFKPLLHWVATSADLKLVINLGSVFHDVGFDDPDPISLFSGSLGSVYTSVGLDTEVSNAVAAEVGFDPGFGAAIAAGNIPIPLTDPALQHLTSGVTPVMGAASFVFNTDVTPATTLAFLTPAPTVFGWNNTSVDVTLSAADTPGGSGVKNITYSAAGAQFIAPTTNPGNLTVVHITTPGITTVTYHSTDNQSNVESDKQIVVRIDEIAPSIVVTQPVNGNYTHSSTLTLDYLVTDAGGSGLNSFTPLLDGSPTLAGHGLASGQAIPLLTELALGSHTFTIDADDRAANTSHGSVTFNIIVTPESIKQDLDLLIAGGDITKAKLKNSLLAKLTAAANAISRGNCGAATNIYQAFINEVNAQSGKGLDATAANILIADAQYLIDHCTSLIAAATLAGGPLGGPGGGGGGGGTGNPIDDPNGDGGGGWAGSGLASGDADGAVRSLLFGGRTQVAWPSPYREGTLSIAFAVSGRSDGENNVLIYDLAGRMVRELSSTPYASGYRIATWDGADNRGDRVSRGMYFIRTGGPQGQLLRLAVIR